MAEPVPHEGGNARRKVPSRSCYSCINAVCDGLSLQMMRFLQHLLYYGVISHVCF